MTYSLLLGFAIRIKFTISHKKMPLILEGIFFHFFTFAAACQTASMLAGTRDAQYE